jgi:hypothetical protein
LADKKQSSDSQTQPTDAPAATAATEESRHDHRAYGERETYPRETPAAPKPTKTIVRVLTSCYDDNGKLRDPGDIFATTRGGALIAGRECSNAETELQAKLDADQQAVEKLKTA